MRRFLNLIRYHRNWLKYLWIKYLAKQKTDFTFLTRSGMSITVPKRMMQTYKECFFDDSYFKGFPEKFRKISPNIIIDIGANVGYFSLFVLHKFPGAKVFAYEPVPANFRLLEKYQKENASRSLTLFNQGVSGQESILKLYLDPSDSFTTDASIYNSGGHSESIEIQCTTLKNIISDNQLNKIDFLKLDCEGSEYSILYETPKEILKKIERIAVETHIVSGPGQDMSSLEKFLNENDFATSIRGSKIYAWYESLL